MASTYRTFTLKTHLSEALETRESQIHSLIRLINTRYLHQGSGEYLGPQVSMVICTFLHHMTRCRCRKRKSYFEYRYNHNKPVQLSIFTDCKTSASESSNTNLKFNTSSTDPITVQITLNFLYISSSISPQK